MTDFIGDYLKYSTEMSSADKLFHLSQALFVLSVCVGRTPIQLTPQPKYPNINSLIIGATRFTHKSTAMDLAVAILPENAHHLAENITMEALIREISEIETTYGKGEIWSQTDELGAILSSYSKKYMAQAKQVMQTLNDCKRIARATITRQTEECERPYPCSTGATTSEVFLKWINRSDIESGFLARSLVVVGDIKPYKARRELTPQDMERRDSLRKWAVALWEVFHKTQKGQVCLDDKEFVLSPEANEFYTVQEKSIHDKVFEDPELATELAMELAYLENALKISALIRISRSDVAELGASSRITIEESDIKEAISISKQFYRSAKKCLDLITKNFYSIVLEEIPEEPDKIERQELCRKLQHIAKAETLDHLLSLMLRDGVVASDLIEKQGKTRKYNVRRYWRPIFPKPYVKKF
jgi:hypothetical protein